MEHTATRSSFARVLLFGGTFFSAIVGHAQQITLWLEEFDGGASTTGFSIDTANVTDCRWEYAPDSVGALDFSQDIGNFWPAGAGFDSSFIFLDSDACGDNSVVVNSYVTSAAFDASALGHYWLHYAHQFQARLQSFCRIEVSPDGNTWTEVAYYTGTSVGYPNPSVVDSVNITQATVASPTTLVRFQFNAGWDWWWALDSISVSFTPASVGLEERADAPTVQAYPNPVNDVLTIAYAGPRASAVVVRDMVGHVVLKAASTSLLNVSAIGAGSYEVELLDASGAVLGRTRFIKR